MGTYTKSQLDEAVDIFGAGFVSSRNAGTISRPTKNASAQCRLLNILFHDEFYARFSNIYDTPDRLDLDSNNKNGNSLFFKDVALAMQSPEPKFGNVILDLPQFNGLDPSIIPTPAFLANEVYEMWEEVQRLFGVLFGVLFFLGCCWVW